MMWNVYYTNDAKQDLQDIYSYISYILLEPITARNQTNRIMDAIDSLEHMPLRHRLYEHEPWYSKGLRSFPVDNYLVFYLPEETKNSVAVIRIMYCGRNTQKHLVKTE